MQTHNQDSPSTHRESSTWRQGGKFWIYGIFAAFGLFISSVAVFLFIAFSQDYDLVRPDYYEAEAQHDKHQLSALRAMQSPEKMTLNYRSKAQEIELDFGKRARGPIVAKLHLYRAADADQDRRHDIRLDGPPYTSLFSTADLVPGKWSAKVSWVSEGKEYFKEIALDIKAKNRP